MGTWTKLPSSLRGGIASAVRFRSPKPEWKPSRGDDSIGIAGIVPVIGDRSLGALEEYGRLLAVLEQRVRVKGAMLRATLSLDYGRHCPPAVETGVGGVFIVEGASFVPIGERTSDNGVRVRQKRLSRCVAAFAHLAGFLAFPAPPVHRLCRSEDTGGGRERPPFLDCLDRQCGVASCAQLMPLPRGVAPVSKYPCGKTEEPMRNPEMRLSRGVWPEGGVADAD